METSRALNNVKAQLRSFIKRNFGAAARLSELQDELPLLAQGIVDSLGVLELVGFLETELQVRVADEDLTPENFQTINALASLVCSKQAGCTDGRQEK